MTPAEVESLFTHPEGYRFARWGRPIVPVVFGVDDATLGIVKGAVEAVVAASGHKMAEHDPELGANLIVFFFRDWAELADVPNLDRMVPDVAQFAKRQAKVSSNVARFFRFDDQGAIKFSVLFLRIDDSLTDAPASVLMLDQAARTMATFNPEAVMMSEGGVKGEIGALLRAAYDPVMPATATDKSHALRLAARL